MAKQNIIYDDAAVRKLLLNQLAADYARHALPVIEGGVFTGDFYDPRKEKPEGQPSTERLTFHLQYMKQQGLYSGPVGQPINGFDPVDPVKSEGFGESLLNIGKMAAESSIEGLAVEALSGGEKSILDFTPGVDPLPAGFQPEWYESLASEVLSFFSPVGIATLGGGSALGKVILQQIIKKSLTTKLLAKGASKVAARRSAAVLTRRVVRSGFEPVIAKTIGKNKAVLEAVFKEAKSIGGRVTQGIAVSGGALGAFEGLQSPFAKGIERGSMDLSDALEDVLGGIAHGITLGAAFGGVGGAVPTKIGAAFLKSETAQKGLSGLAKYGSEVGILGGAMPVIEGRVPTADDFLQAAQFIAAMKTVHGGIKVTKRWLNRKVETLNTEYEKRVQEGEKNKDALSGILSDEVAEVIDSRRVTREITKEGPTRAERLAKTQKAIKVVQEKELAKPTKQQKADLVKRRIQTKEIRGGREFLEITTEGTKVSLRKLKNKQTITLQDAVDIKAVEEVLVKAKAKNSDVYYSLQIEKKSKLFQEMRDRGLVSKERTNKRFRAVIPKTIFIAKPVQGEITRSNFKQKLKESFNLKAEEATAVDVITKARADTWAKETGKKPEDYYTERFVKIEKGDVTGRNKRGMAIFASDGRAVLRGLKSPDISTAVHELAHVFRRDIKPEHLVVANEWAGVKNNKWSRANEEKFARAFERYLREGKAPTTKLATVFEKFKDWLRNIYQSIKGSAIDIKINPSLRRVFNEMLGGKAVKPKKGEPPLFQSAEELLKAKPKNKADNREQMKREAEAVKGLGEKERRIFSTTRSWIRAFVGLLSPLEKKLKQPESKEIASRMQTGNYVRAGIRSTMTEKLEKLGVLELTDAEAIKKSKSVEAGKEPEINAWFNEHFDMRIRAIRHAEGKKVAHLTDEQILGKRENYLPRIIREEISEQLMGSIAALRKSLGLRLKNASDPTIRNALTAKSARIRGEIISKNVPGYEGREVLITALEHIKLEGNYKSLRKAFIELEKNVVSDAILPEAGHEKRRKLILPSSFYEDNVKIIMLHYNRIASRRTAEIYTFGRYGDKAIDLLREVEKVDFKEAKLAEKALRMWSGQWYVKHALSPNLKKLLDIWTAFQVGAKIGLGRATVLNLTQWAISFMPVVGAWNTMRGGIDMFDPAKRKALRRIGIDDLYKEAAIMAVTGEGFAGGRMGKFAEFTTKWSGFTAINRLNLYWAAASFQHAVKRWIPQARGTGKKAEARRRVLSKFGIDYKKDYNEKQLAEGMHRFAMDSQLQKNILKEPLFFQEQWARPFILFKRFGYRQYIWSKDMIVLEMFKGNVAPMLRLGVAGFFGGTGVIWGLNNIKEALSGQPVYRKDDTMWDKAIQNLAVIGAFGAMSDMIELEKLSDLARRVKFTVYPVFVSDAERVMDSWTAFMRDWENYGDVWTATKRNSYRLFGFAGSYPKYAAERLKTKGQEEAFRRFKRGQEKTEIWDLIFDANPDAASRRMADWNKRFPGKLGFRVHEFSGRERNKYIKRQIEKQVAVELERGTPEFRRKVREGILKLKEKFNGSP